MKKILFLMLLGFALLSCGDSASAQLYEKRQDVPIRTALDQAMLRRWQAVNLPVSKEASDGVLLRRATLALTGSLPTWQEVRSYCRDESPDKYEKLVDRLLADSRFTDYWTMKWADALRIKSEFPINLWPNAVYGYHRFIRQAVAENRPLDQFARQLLNATGSNFRTPEANFFRATADRSPEGIARAAMLTLLGSRPEHWSKAEQQRFASCFRDVAFKKTMEWKEEIVYLANPEQDRRQAFADYLFAPPQNRFAIAMAHRLWFWMFGQALDCEADNLPAEAFENPTPAARLLAKELASNGYDLRKFCRMLALSAPFRVSPLPAAGTSGDEARAAFAAFPMRRLDAEVLDDAIADLTGVPSKYASVIPEPFSILPPEKHTVTLEDGSIGNSFLTIFGRPSRDAGRLDERPNDVTAKQRLWLFNSAELYRKLQKLQRRKELQKAWAEQRIELMYLMTLSRKPNAKETALSLDEFQSRKGNYKWQFWTELAWHLVNSREFLYQH